MPVRQSDPPTSRRLGRRLGALLLGSGAAIAVAAILFWALPDDSELPAAGTVHFHQATHGQTSKGPDDPRPPKGPNPYFFAQRAYPLGEIPVERWRMAVATARSLQAEAERRGGPTWVFRGPTNIGGRITDIAAHPTNPAIVFAASAEGGVLRTTNSGSTWEPIFDDQPTLSIGAIAIDPHSPETVYAGTGEVNPGGGSVAYGGLGMFRSTNLGDSWEPLGLEETGSIGRILVDPIDGDRLFVAATGRLWSPNPERGVYRTTNAGATWEQVLFVADDAGAVDLIQRPDQPNVLLAAIWQRMRQPEAYDYGGPRCAVYGTTDGGDTWAVVGGGLPAPNNNDGRIGLSLCEGSPDVMHAVYADRTGFFDGLYRSTNGGTSWTRTNDGALSGIFASYGWWFGNVRTHPTNPLRIWVLGLHFYRSTNGGASWSNAGASMHVDHHGMDFGPGANPIWEGNDGGVYRSTNGGTAWTFVGTQPNTQFYRVALDAQNPNAILGGSQDNGTLRSTTGALDDFSELYGGDGFGPLVHPTSSSRIWAQYQYGNLFYSSNNGGSFRGATLGIGGSDRRNWNSPIEQDPTNPDRRYFGTNRLYRSLSDTSWIAISPDLTGGPHLGNSGQVMGTLTVIGASPIDPDVIWTGSDDGYVHVTTNAGSSWTRVDAAIDDRWVTSVHADPVDRETAYVTISGFRWDEPMPRIYRTTDLGASWTPIPGNLPDVPLNDVFIDPEETNHLVVASDFGVYETFDGGSNWSPLGSGLPNVVVTDLEFDAAGRRLVAATFGRSFFEITLDSPTSVPDVADGNGEGSGVEGLSALTLATPHPNPMREGTTIRWNAARSGRGHLGVYSVSGRLVRDIPVDWSVQGGGGGASGVDAGGGDAAGASSGGSAGAAGSVHWDGRDESGREVPSGVYVLRLRTEDGASNGTTVTVRR